MKIYKMDCGCNFPIREDIIKSKGKTLEYYVDNNLVPPLTLDIANVPTDCKYVWEMLGKGLTKGVFQLESQLGRQWTKKLKPESIKHLAALGSILRPGCLRSIDANTGLSLTELYCQRKNGLLPIEYLHPVLEPILKDTYGVLCFQEESMFISQKVAGFDLQQADMLRKCITKESKFVSKSRGYITLGQMLRTGYKEDLFLTMDDCGNQSWDNITDVWFTKFNAGVKVKTKQGNYIKCTEDHKILTNRGWVEAQNITTEDYIVSSRKSDFDGIDTISDDLAIIITGLICEGFFSEKHCTFTNFDKEMMDIFTKSCEKVFPKQYINKSNEKVLHIKRGARPIIYKYLDIGKSKTKKLPIELETCTKEQCRKFLSFALACEGGISKTGQFEFCSKSKIFCYQIKRALRRFGIVSYIKTKDVENYGRFYRLYINDITQQKILLKELTVLWPGIKIEQLTSIITKKGDSCFSGDRLPKNLCQKLIDDGCKPKEGSVNFMKREVSFAKLKRIAHNDYWINFSNGNHYYDKVESVTHIKQARMYDFSMGNVKQPQAIVNDMVVSNSIGKKLPEEMAKVEVMFFEGAKKANIVSEDQAKEIFGWIKESQRYQFNASHSYSYAINGYWSAYCKAHFPVQFFTSYLRFAKEKQDPLMEIRELINEAKLMDIEVLTPDLRSMKKHFFTDGKQIQFGLADVKGIGEAQVEKLRSAVLFAEETYGKKLPEFSWYEFLVLVSPNVSSTVAERLIEVGALSYMDKQ